MKIARALAIALSFSVAAIATLAQERPPAAGDEGVPVPRRIRSVPPEYPAEAAAAGLRGIVILELTIDTKGKVVEVKVVRSIPAFDDAAVAAARRWEYEPVMVGGRPSPVRLTVPVTFSLRLPDVERQPGIPELRAGSMVVASKGKAKGSATVAITIGPSGDVLEVEPVSGDGPLVESLMKAARTWRFASLEGDETASFRLEGVFSPGESGQPGLVKLRLSGLHRELPRTAAGKIDRAADQLVPTQPAPPAPASAASPSAASVPDEPPPASTSIPAVSENAETPAPPSAAGSSASGPTSPAPSPDTPAPAAAGSTAVPDEKPTAPLTAPPTPAIETVAAPPAPNRIVEAGGSAIRDVRFEGQIPDLVRGRRPAAPPLARVRGESGDVTVAFSVDAAGVTLVRSIEGPETFERATRELVGSWLFRRLSPERIFLVAVVSYKGDTASAVIRPQRQQ